MLLYALSYRGVGIGNFELRAESRGEGWRFWGRPAGFSLARALGFELEMRSETGPDLTTRRFEKRLRSPLVGEILLVATAQEEVRAVRFENGRPAGSYRARVGAVFDDLSLVYHIRVRPRAGELAFLGLYGVVRGRLELVGEEEVRVPAGRFRAQVFRFDRPEAFFELALSPSRLPVRIVLGYGGERVVASLLEVR